MKRDTWVWILAIGFIAVSITGGGILLSVLTITDIARVARNVGFSGKDLITAVAIAMAESHGNPNAHGDTSLGTGTGSFGLWQIYADAHPEYGPDFTKLYDPQTNANAAYEIYQKAGYSFRPWTTFNTGTYLSFVPTVSDTIQA